MFEVVLGFLANLSVVLWATVILTMVIRFVGIRAYLRRAPHRAVVDTSASVPAMSLSQSIDPAELAAFHLSDADLIRLTQAESNRVTTGPGSQSVDLAEFQTVDGVWASSDGEQPTERFSRSRSAESTSDEAAPTLVFSSEGA